MEFPELLILQLIAQQPMYGYEIVGAIRLRSEEALSIGEGSIYPILHRLEKRKLIRGRRENVKGAKPRHLQTNPTRSQAAR